MINLSRFSTRGLVFFLLRGAEHVPIWPVPPNWSNTGHWPLVSLLLLWKHDTGHHLIWCPWKKLVKTLHIVSPGRPPAVPQTCWFFIWQYPRNTSRKIWEMHFQNMKKKVTKCNLRAASLKQSKTDIAHPIDHCHVQNLLILHLLVSGGFVLLAPTGALIVMMVYYISGSAHFFRFSLSPLMQLMLQVSL